MADKTPDDPKALAAALARVLTDLDRDVPSAAATAYTTPARASAAPVTLASLAGMRGRLRPRARGEVTFFPGTAEDLKAALRRAGVDEADPPADPAGSRWPVPPPSAGAEIIEVSGGFLIGAPADLDAFRRPVR